MNFLTQNYYHNYVTLSKHLYEKNRFHISYEKNK